MELYSGLSDRKHNQTPRTVQTFFAPIPPLKPPPKPPSKPPPKLPYIYYMLINPYKTHTRINRIYVTYSTYSTYSVFLCVFAPFRIMKNILFINIV